MSLQNERDDPTDPRLPSRIAGDDSGRGVRRRTLVGNLRYRRTDPFPRARDFSDENDGFWSKPSNQHGRSFPEIMGHLIQRLQGV